ncbi:hypothetical protein NQ318_019676 [Aromia moschata]|uniref:HORMA domain-containing protein n=1 Tax=Aromia moschata TaxID=1265417 RepID=A0AAV8Z459_9CUCU|nr:hypothetical protein NQ318_019676 [Aromia moschata]
MSSDRISVSDIVCEFFEVIVHSILHARKLYPETIFSTKRKYGVAVYQSVHPDINEYINQSLKAVHFHAKNNHLKKFFCKYVFDVVNIVNFVESDPFLVELERSLRDFIVKLHTTQNYLDDLPDETSFSVRIETTAYSSLEFNQEAEFEDFPWIELDSDEICDSSADIVPLHTVKCPFLTLQIDK